MNKFTLFVGAFRCVIVAIEQSFAQIVLFDVMKAILVPRLKITKLKLNYKFGGSFFDIYLLECNLEKKI